MAEPRDRMFAMLEILSIEVAVGCGELRGDDVVHLECPSCLFEFSKTGDKLWGWDFAGMVLAGRVTRVEEIKAH